MPTGTRPCIAACEHDTRRTTLSERRQQPRPRACAPEVIRRARNDIRKKLRPHRRVCLRLSRCAVQLCCRAGGSAEVRAAHTSILMRPALCPPIEMSKKTTGFPPAAPGIEPIPDMRSCQQRCGGCGGCGGQWPLQKHRRRGSAGGGRASTRRAGVRDELPGGADVGGGWWSGLTSNARGRGAAHTRWRQKSSWCEPPPLPLAANG